MPREAHKPWDHQDDHDNCVADIPDHNRLEGTTLLANRRPHESPCFVASTRTGGTAKCTPWPFSASKSWSESTGSGRTFAGLAVGERALTILGEKAGTLRAAASLAPAPKALAFESSGDVRGSSVTCKGTTRVASSSVGTSTAEVSSAPSVRFLGVPAAVSGPLPGANVRFAAILSFGCADNADNFCLGVSGRDQDDIASFVDLGTS